MQRRSIIIVQKGEGKIQAWGNFKKACRENELPYHSLKFKKFPISYEQFEIQKIPFNELPANI